MYTCSENCSPRQQGTVRGEGEETQWQSRRRRATRLVQAMRRQQFGTKAKGEVEREGKHLERMPQRSRHDDKTAELGSSRQRRRQPGHSYSGRRGRP